MEVNLTMHDSQLDLTTVPWSPQKETVRVFYKEMWDNANTTLVPSIFHPWITGDCTQTLGWSQLTQKSGFSKEQLIELFQLYKQVSPLTFVRQVRQQHKDNQIINPQPELFDNIKN